MVMDKSGIKNIVNQGIRDQSKVLLDIVLPVDFPEKYEKSVGKMVDGCLVASLGRDLNESSFDKSISRSEK